MRLLLAAGALNLLIASPVLAQDCRTEIDALDATLQERYPELFKTAGDTQQANATTATSGGGEALSGDPAMGTDVPTAEDVPSSVMPGAAPEIEQEEEDPAATSDTSSTASSTSPPAGTAANLSQEQVDKIQTLRALAEERLDAGSQDECNKAVSDAKTVLEGQ